MTMRNGLWRHTFCYGKRFRRVIFCSVLFCCLWRGVARRWCLYLTLLWLDITRMITCYDESVRCNNSTRCPRVFKLTIVQAPRQCDSSRNPSGDVACANGRLEGRAQNSNEIIVGSSLTKYSCSAVPKGWVIHISIHYQQTVQARSRIKYLQLNRPSGIVDLALS